MAKYRITGPDGSTYEITAPEGASEQDVMAFVQSQIGGQAQQPMSLADLPNQTVLPIPERTTMQNIGGGFRQGVLDVGGALTRGGDYLAEQVLGFSPHERFVGQSVQEKSQNLNRNFEQDYGDSWGATGGRIGGQLAASLPATVGIGAGVQAAGRAVPALAPAAQFVSGTGGLGSRMTQGAVLGGTASGLATGGASEDILRDVAIGAGVGAALPVVGEAGRALGRKAGRAIQSATTGGAQRKAANEFIRNTPDTDALKRIAHDTYAKAEQLGVVVRPEPYRDAVSKIAAQAQRDGINPTLHPRATAALQEMQRAADNPMTLSELETVRRIVNAAARSVDPDERRVAYTLINGLDDFVGGLTPEQTLAGGQNAAAASEILSNARALWSRAKKSELMDWAFTRAANQPSGMENGLRIQFRQILNNKQLRRGFSPDEIQAMEKVVQGDFTTNTLRRIGKLSAGSGAQSNMLNAMMGTGLGAGVGGTVGGPVGAAIGAGSVAGLGYGAQRGAEALTTRNARLAQALMASGAADIPPAEASRLAQLLMSIGPGQQAGNVAIPATTLGLTNALRQP